MEINHDGEDDWEVRLIDQPDNAKKNLKGESFCQNGLILFKLIN